MISPEPSPHGRALRERISRVVGPLAECNIGESIRFRAARPVTLKDLIALSKELGTDAINFDFGDDGEPGYSEYTPGEPGRAGYVEVLFPIKEAP